VSTPGHQPSVVGADRRVCPIAWIPTPDSHLLPQPLAPITDPRLPLLVRGTNIARLANVHAASDVMPKHAQAVSLAARANRGILLRA
jgi:hypothetical protein